MTKKEKQIFILDTNVLIHDPSAIFRFHEHDIYLPMVVLEELDNNKKGHSEVARNARQASRFLDEITTNISPEELKEGILLNKRDEFIKQLNSDDEDDFSSGRLFFQTNAEQFKLPVTFPGHKNDNDILAITLALQEDKDYPFVSLVSKDINLRIKAASIGVRVEDYQNDQALDDVNLLYSGYQCLPANFWEQNDQEVESWNEDGRSFYKINGEQVKNWYPNEFLTIEDDTSYEVTVRSIDCESKPPIAVVERIQNYANDRNLVWGIKALNDEQNYALNLLMDPEIDFVSLVGQAGTGKTLLTLAAGLSQVLDTNLYKEIIMTRATISVGEDIGFLPGTEEEKMAPWMGALMDNLEVLTHGSDKSDWGQAATNDLLTNKIKIRALNFMRGRTFLNRYIIIDEAQNLTSKQMKTLITRSGPGSKIVCLGNVAQIDTPYLTETTSGLTYTVDRFKSWAHSGHVTLKRGERSRLADFAADVL
jgi:PhoH-like ATPase